MEGKRGHGVINLISNNKQAKLQALLPIMTRKGEKSLVTMNRPRRPERVAVVVGGSGARPEESRV